MKKTVIIVGGGASVKNGIDNGLWEKIKGLDVWSINYAFMTMPYLPAKEIWVDADFYKNNASALQKLYESGCVLATRKHPRHAGIIEFSEQYDSTTEASLFQGREGKSKGLIFRGRMGLSGVFALSLAVAYGYERIYLLGYDFGTKNTEQTFTHYYQNDLKSIYSTGVKHPEVYLMPDNRTRREVTDFDIFLNCGAKIWNVSPDSNINSFSKITYDEMFEQLKESHV